MYYFLITFSYLYYRNLFHKFMGDRKVRIIFSILLIFGTVGLLINFDVYALDDLICDPNYEYRSFNGTCNNLDNPLYGSAGTELLRIANNDYSDNISSPSEDRPNPRYISNQLASQEGSIPNSHGASDFIWQWGQFVDHDIDLTSSADPLEPFYIPVNFYDFFFNPNNEQGKEIILFRSIHNGGTTEQYPRQQINQITSFIDASNVYGSDESLAMELRDDKNPAKLKTSRGDFLPEVNGFFKAGDVRANEQIGLTSMHTLFVREHNRVANEIASKHPDFTDEQIYQTARKIVGAEIQVITYNEFLPKLLGQDAIPPYDGYDPTINPGIANEFSTASYRYGHSQLSPNLMIVDNSYMEYVPLRDAFFNPSLFKEKGLEGILRGLASQKAQEIDNKVVDDVRNFLFGPPGAGGFDLASLNIQRGRDHGLPSYNTVRIAYGLMPAADFGDVTTDSVLKAKLESTYGTIDKLDLWVGGLAEDHEEGAMVGETIKTVLIDQFTRLRDGDRFWYANDQFFIDNPIHMQKVTNTTLSEIIKQNTRINDSKIQDDVFVCQYMKGGGQEKKLSEFLACE